jgi:deoxycytidine triphosphate deaminase
VSPARNIVAVSASRTLPVKKGLQSEFMMTVLVDHQIDQLLGATPPLATNVPHGDFRGPDSRIQAASLDLTIGDIFIPGADADKPGGLRSPHTRVSLREGRIAVIRTNETLAMPSNVVALGFPPASLSIRGVLMTNPGQIDPGYHGQLHLTVINMSKEPLALFRGQRLIRLIFAKLDGVPSADFQARHPQPLRSPITDELLQSLSIDFLNVEQRAKDMIEKTERKTQILSGLIAAVVGIAITALTKFVPRLLDRYYALEAKIDGLEAKADVSSLKDRLDRLETAAKPASTAPGPAPNPGAAPASYPARSPRP